jgi:long-chain acyl-CoA synthetase
MFAPSLDSRLKKESALQQRAGDTSPDGLLGLPAQPGPDPDHEGRPVVPGNQQPVTGLIPRTDDWPGCRSDNSSVTNLAKNLTDTTRVHAGRVAVRVDNAAMTYRALDEASARVAGLLHERGLKPGDRVGIMMPNVAEVPVVYYGILRTGAVVVPMNPLLKAREVAYYLSDSGAGLFFAWHAFETEARAGAEQVTAELIVVDEVGFPDLLASAAPVEGVTDRHSGDTAVILYTSGTTGQPKGAELTHGNLISNTDIARTDIVRARPEDVIFGGLPLFHVFGQTVALNVAVASGACLTLLPRFDPAHALRIIAGHHVTVFEGVPTMYVALLHLPDRGDYDVSTLRMCVSGGAALPVEVLRGFEDAFGCTVLEGYGLSETSPVASFNHPGRERKPGSIGTPIRGVQMRVVDNSDHEVPQGEVGEIVIRGPNVMKGYWHRPDATAEAIRDGWFHSGDLARVDEEGYFYIVDRKKDLIIRGGYNVYPREIEEVLYEHPAVAEAAVIGLPHPALGEEVAAAVALKPGATVSTEELRDYVKGQVAAYKYPRHVWLVDVLPKGPTGKIQKRDIVVPARLGAG